nr:RNA-directed DNA polymerase, eukaryota [Tanacetum cinerariifolium]
MEDIWFFDLNGDGRFCVKDVRCLLDDVFLPKAEVPTRWIKSIPIKINIFAWKLCLDRLPTRVNLAKRNVAVASLLCPLCDSGMEDAAHLCFRCDMAKDVMFFVSRWWDLEDRRENKDDVEMTGFDRSACLKCGGVVDGRKVFDEMTERDGVSWNSVAFGYVKMGSMNMARELFDEMPEKSIVSWTVMISGYAIVGSTTDALGIFHMM